MAMAKTDSAAWALGKSLLALAAGSALVARIAAVSPKDPALADTLAIAASRLEQLAHDVDGVVIAEDYVQEGQAQSVSLRRLQSDIVLLADSSVGWIEFRDTTAVDGKPVADRETRVADLFAHPSASAMEQARRIVREGARFNLVPFGETLDRTLNLPMAALAFLRPENQSRSTFKLDGSASVGGVRTNVVPFKEQTSPRLIGTPDGAAASGTFWIDPASGGVRRSELKLTTRRGPTAVDATIRVEYQDVPALHLLLPKVMDEFYMVTNNGSRAAVVEGHAVYSNYRQFNVAVSEQAAPGDEAK
jgi:hypothetical protein